MAKTGTEGKKHWYQLHPFRNQPTLMFIRLKETSISLDWDFKSTFTEPELHISTCRTPKEGAHSFSKITRESLLYRDKGKEFLFPTTVFTCP